MATTPNKDQVQGEGDYDAGRRYDKASREFAESGKVEPAARDAAPTTRAKPKTGARRERRQVAREGRRTRSSATSASPAPDQRLATRRAPAAARRGARGAADASGGTCADFGLRTGAGMTPLVRDQRRRIRCRSARHPSSPPGR